jgi:hypothetical protein
MARTPSYRTADATVSAYDASSVTPSDSADILPTRGLYIGGAGDVKVDMALGNTVTFVGLLAGSILPVQVKRVYSTDTTATSIVALY